MDESFEWTGCSEGLICIFMAECAELSFLTGVFLKQEAAAEREINVSLRKDTNNGKNK